MVPVKNAGSLPAWVGKESAESPQDVLEKARAATDPLALLPAPVRKTLFDKLAENQRIRRETEVDSEFLKLG